MPHWYDGGCDNGFPSRSWQAPGLPGWSRRSSSRDIGERCKQDWTAGQTKGTLLPGSWCPFWPTYSQMPFQVNIKLSSTLKQHGGINKKHHLAMFFQLNVKKFDRTMGSFKKKYNLNFFRIGPHSPPPLSKCERQILKKNKFNYIFTVLNKF